MIGKSYVTRCIPYVFILVAGWIVAAMPSDSAMAQRAERNGHEAKTVPEPLPAGVSADRVFAELVARNDARTAALTEYRVSRTYQVIDLKGKVHAEIRGQMEYRAPGKKSFRVTSEAGSYLVRQLALHPLITAEISAASGEEHRDSSFTPTNYTLDLLGQEQIGPSLCYVAQAIPRRKDKYLFEGKVWIDARDYAIVRIEGHPARRLSFWIQQADILRQYENFNGFWLPEEDKTVVDVRLYGKHIVAIVYRDYAVVPAAYKASVVPDSIESGAFHSARPVGTSPSTEAQR